MRDPQDPEYWIPFVKTTSDVALEEAPTFPQFIIISSKSLEILVEDASSSSLQWLLTDVFYRLMKQPRQTIDTMLMMVK